MAVVRNKTGDTLALFSPDAPPIDPGGEVTLRDEVVAGRAWPRETWHMVTPPDREVWKDESTEDAYLYVPKPEPKKAPAKKAAAKKGDN